MQLQRFPRLAADYKVLAKVSSKPWEVHFVMPEDGERERASFMETILTGTSRGARWAGSMVPGGGVIPSGPMGILGRLGQESQKR